VNSIPADQEILFLPDFFLGAHVRRVSGRSNIHIWLGECHVHAGITPSSLARQREEHPGAELLVHPECGCATSVVEAMSAGAIPSDGVQVLSTEGMIRRPAESDNREFIVATETGILYRLRRANPDKTFYAASDRAECQYMKMTTLPKVLRSLESMEHRITVPTDIADRARRALERMVAVGGGTSGPPLVGVAGFDPGE
jgi:quinolinate synthase